MKIIVSVYTLLLAARPRTIGVSLSQVSICFNRKNPKQLLQNPLIEIHPFVYACVGVPLLSAPVERLISIAGKVFRPEGCNLIDNRFEELMFICCNNN